VTRKAIVSRNDGIALRQIEQHGALHRYMTTGGVAYATMAGKRIPSRTVWRLLNAGLLVANGDALLPGETQTYRVSTPEERK
jgi:hypothetical protein